MHSFDGPELIARGFFCICTTGKSIEPIIVKSRRAWLASALSVVVNTQADALTYQLDGEVKAHHGDDG